MEKEIKMYKCYYPDGSYQVMFSNDGELLRECNDLSGAEWQSSDFTKIEPLEQQDTLQEVLDSIRNGESIELFNDCSGSYNYGDFSFNNKVELLEHIRQPKLKQITPKELAKMGFEIKND